MANTVITLKKSGTASNIPSSLSFGELALNYADGKLYYKNASGVIGEIKTSTSNSYFGTVNASGTLIVADTPGDILTLTSDSTITITPDAVNDVITLSAPGIASAFQKANDASNTANAAFLAANIPPPRSITIESPSSTEKIAMFFNAYAFPISQIRSVVRGSSPSVTFSIRYGPDYSATGTEVVTSGITTTNTTYGLATTSFTNGTIPANNMVWLTTSATSGTVDQLHISIV